MRHELRMEGCAFGLRPVGQGDSAFIVTLRSGNERARFLHPISPDIRVQEKWVEEYFSRQGDYYFVIERLEPRMNEGLVAIYNVNPLGRCAEWGRWIVRPGSWAAVESALLVYRMGFEVIDLAEIYCRTIVENSSVVSFHDSSGLEQRAVLPGYFELHGLKYDAVEHVLTRERWPLVREKLVAQAQRIAKRLNRGGIMPGGGQ